MCRSAPQTQRNFIRTEHLKIHFVGIGGIGISGLARFMNFTGHSVSGSDMKRSVITDTLQKEGITVSIPHESSAVEDKEIVIHTAAAKPTNVELARAKELGIKTLSRKEALPMILGDKKVYSVCGAHGKSTTTAILASIFSECSAIIGAESKEFKSNIRFKNSECVVFEADESDSSFLNSNPYCAIVTNAEPEHMEHYDYDLERFHQAYIDFLNKAQIRIINAEDEFLGALEIDAVKLYPSKDIKNIEFVLIEDEPHTKFELLDLGEFCVWGFGEHIAIDAALAVLAAKNELDIEMIKERLLHFKGIKKRFDIIHKNGSVMIDDYAHHPTEIAATLSSIKKYADLKGIKEIISIWQPHKYSRTILNLNKFIECFAGSGKLIILPVWSAGEDAVDIDFQDNFKRYNPTLADRIKRENDKLLIIKGDEVIDSLQSGLIVGFGAGDITYQIRGVS